MPPKLKPIVPGGLHAGHLDERQPEDPSRAERLAEPAEEDLHPRLHEHALGPLAHPMELDEAVEERDQRVRGRGHDRERAGLRLELAGLPLDLVPELRRQLLRGTRPTSRAARRNGATPFWSSVSSTRQPVAGAPSRGAGRATARSSGSPRRSASVQSSRVQQPGPELLAPSPPARSGSADRSHVVGDLGAAEEPQRRPDPFERHRADLRSVVVLREREQQVLGRLAELLPVELQVVRRVEERARRIRVDERRPVRGRGSPAGPQRRRCARRPMLRVTTTRRRRHRRRRPRSRHPRSRSSRRTPASTRSCLRS